MSILTILTGVRANDVALAMPQLPPEVRQTGLTTRKRSPELLLTISFNSPDGTYDQLYLSNYASLHIKEELARLPGISDVTRAVMVARVSGAMRPL